MKINTKVVFKWNDDSKQYEEIYCESYDYDGEVAECQTEWEEEQFVVELAPPPPSLPQETGSQGSMWDMSWLWDMFSGKPPPPSGSPGEKDIYGFGTPPPPYTSRLEGGGDQGWINELMASAGTDANPEAAAAYQKYISQGRQPGVDLRRGGEYTPEGMMRSGPGDEGLVAKFQYPTGEVPGVDQMYGTRFGKSAKEVGGALAKYGVGYPLAATAGALKYGWQGTDKPGGGISSIPDVATKAIGAGASWLYEGRKDMPGGGLKGMAGGIGKFFGKSGAGSKLLSGIGGGSMLAGVGTALGAYSAWRGAKRQREGLGKAIKELNKPLAMYKSEYDTLSKEAKSYKPGGEYSQYAVGKTFDMAESGADKAVGELSARGIDSASMASQLSRGSYSKAAENVPGVIMDVAKGGMMYDKLALGALGSMTELHGDIAQLKGARGRIDPTQALISSLGSSMFNIPMLQMMYKDKGPK